MSIANGNPKRVITGHRPDGTSYFARVDEAQPLEAAAAEGREVWRVWGADTQPVKLPTAGPWPQGSKPDPASVEVFLSQLPPAGGVRCTMVRFHPGYIDDLYAVDTADVVFILDGELVYALDNGEEMTVRHGDVVIQNGVKKSWRNRSDKPAMIAALVMSSDKSPPAAS